jgi:hypothetical protein
MPRDYQSGENSCFSAIQYLSLPEGSAPYFVQIRFVQATASKTAVVLARKWVDPKTLATKHIAKTRKAAFSSKTRAGEDQYLSGKIKTNCS